MICNFAYKYEHTSRLTHIKTDSNTLCNLLVDACQHPPQTQAKPTAKHLEFQQSPTKLLLCAGAKHVQRQVDQIPVGRCMQQAGGRIKARQAMPGAGHDLEQLRQ